MTTLTVPPATTVRARRNKAVTIAAVAAALILGGVVGAVIVATTNTADPASAPVTAAPVTITAPALPVTGSVPTSPDPVCAEWSSLATDYTAKQSAWAKTDPNVPAAQWTADDRKLNLEVLPVLKSQADDMRRLGDKATDPVVKLLMLQQAAYERLYAERLPNYVPADQSLWQATINFSFAVKTACQTMAR